MATNRNGLVLILACAAAAFTIGAAVKIGDQPDPVPSPSPTVTAVPCQSPLQAHCLESEDDGDMPTMWRESPRATMLTQQMVEVLTDAAPSRDWSYCWLYVSYPAIECPDGFVTEWVG